jgi:Rrf2 family protein
MISQKAKYGLQAMIYIANHNASGNILIADIAKSEKISKKFLESILLDLKNHGILQSKKGKGGGYSLARPPQEIMMGQIVRVLEGPLAPVSCVSQMAYKRCDECKDEVHCGIKLVMKEVRDAVAAILDKTSLQDVIAQTEGAKLGVFNYHI